MISSVPPFRHSLPTASYLFARVEFLNALHENHFNCNDASDINRQNQHRNQRLTAPTLGTRLWKGNQCSKEASLAANCFGRACSAQEDAIESQLHVLLSNMSSCSSSFSYFTYSLCLYSEWGVEIETKSMFFITGIHSIVPFKLLL